MLGICANKLWPNNYCKLTNINNLKLNKMKLVYDVILLNSSHPTTTVVHDEFRLLGSHVHDVKAKWKSSFSQVSLLGVILVQRLHEVCKTPIIRVQGIKCRGLRRLITPSRILILLNLELNRR